MWLWRRVNSIFAKTMSLGFWRENAAVDSGASGVASAQRAAAGQTGWNQKQRIEFCFCSHSENQSPPVRHFMTPSSGRGGHQPGPTVTYMSHVRGEYWSVQRMKLFQRNLNSHFQMLLSQERNRYTTVSWRRHFYFKNYSQPRSIFQLLINSNGWYYYCTLVASEWGNIPSHCCFGSCDCESWMFRICDKIVEPPKRPVWPLWVPASDGSGLLKTGDRHS